MMASIIQLAERRAIRQTADMRGRPKPMREQRFRYPGPDVVSEVSCQPQHEPGVEESRVHEDPAYCAS
jgi:hypothetical protein